MTFECKRCRKRWDVEGFNKKHTFYTLCEYCAQDVVDESAFGKELERIRHKLVGELLKKK